MPADTQSATQRMMALAMEIEEEHELERRAASVRVEEMSQRLSAAEADRLQHQMATLRLEDQLQASQEQAAELASELESERSAQRVQLDRINDLCRELIATRFELARAQKGAADAPRGEEALLEAAAQLDLRAADLILNPACELVPTAADEAGADDGADEAEARSPEVESANGGGGAAKGETGRLGAALGAALHAACVACADASAAEGGGDGEATCAFVEALLLRGAPVDGAHGPADESALHAAARGGAVAVAEMLLERGAPPNARDAEGRTPLHAAVTAGDAPMAEALLRRGADPGLADAGGSTPAASAAAYAAAAGGDVGAGGGEGAGGERRNSGPDGGLGAARAAVAAAVADPALGLLSQAKRATAAYRRGDYASATQSYLDALALAAASPEACHPVDVATLHFNCARAALKEERHVLSLDQASAALRHRPGYGNARMLQAECHMELLEFSEAAAAYRALAELEPDNSAWGECERKATALADASLYDTLGLTSERADAAEVRRAYHAKSKQWHPDRHQATAEASRRANTAFQRITAAYETLSDANKRADYDLQLKLKGLRRRPSSSPRPDGGGGYADPSGYGRTAGAYSSAAYTTEGGERSPRPASGGGGASYKRGGYDYGGREFGYDKNYSPYGDAGPDIRKEYTGRWSGDYRDGAENRGPPPRTRAAWGTPGSAERD